MVSWLMSGFASSLPEILCKNPERLKPMSLQSLLSLSCHGNYLEDYNFILIIIKCDIAYEYRFDIVKKYCCIFLINTYCLVC